MTAFLSRASFERRRRSISREQWLVILGAGALAPFCVVAALRILAVTAFDFPIILAVNSFARRSPIVDHAVRALAAFDLFQGLPLVALACGAIAASRSGRVRVRLAIGIIGASAAAELSRLAQVLLPSLPRPTVDPALPFLQPYGGNPESWRGWSSFPSDHATLLWGMAFATLIVNRRIGAVSIAVATLSSLARLYCGLHYATDILGGALLAIAVVCAFLAGVAPWEERLLSFAKRRPALVATVAFLFGAQAGTLFYDVRKIAALTVHHVKEIGAVSTGGSNVRRPPPQSVF
jgi:membrane-associated phospholipid phosphatase